MVETLKLMEKTDYTIYAVGTVQEEVGLRGAGEQLSRSIQTWQ